MQAVVFAMCCCFLTAQARPGIHGGGHGLQGVPGIGAYGKVEFPKFDILELGEFSKGSLPPETIVSNKEIVIKEPQPYPVKVPHPVHVPYPVHKPYPVVQTKIIKVPQPVPYEIVKKVPVPIEVPKPYPVPVSSHGGSSGGYGGGYGNGIEHQSLGGNEGSYGGGSDYGSGYEGGFGHESSAGTSGEGQGYGGEQFNNYESGEHTESDQSQGYASVEQPESAPVQEEQKI